MNGMTKVAKMLALMPVVALAAACNGVAPTSSTGVPTDLSATDNGSVTAMGSTARPCALISGVYLEVIDENDAAVTLQATYKYSEPTHVDCAAPTWTSRPAVLQVDKMNPFRAVLARTGGGKVLVQATAPNGVSGSISVSVDGRGTADEPVDPGPTTPSKPTTPNRPVPTPPVNACRLIDGVTVSVFRQVGGTVGLSAAYTYSQPVATVCKTAPQWEANRKGLTVNDSDGFKASIPASSDQTVVVVTAPNGVQNKVSF